MSDEKVLGTSQAADYFQLPGSNPVLGNAPDFAGFLKQTGIKMSSLNDFLKTLDGQISIQTEKSAVQRLSTLV